MLSGSEVKCISLRVCSIVKMSPSLPPVRYFSTWLYLKEAIAAHRNVIMLVCLFGN